MDKLDDCQVYLPELWATHARFQPDKEAVVCGARRVTWADFNRGNVFPTDIEEVVGGHPDVLDVTVIGVAHEKWGETPLALVIPKSAAADAAAIRDWANARLAGHQRLAAVEFRAEFPRNALGKVLKRELRAEYGA